MAKKRAFASSDGPLSPAPTHHSSSVDYTPPQSHRYSPDSSMASSRHNSTQPAGSCSGSTGGGHRQLHLASSPPESSLSPRSERRDATPADESGPWKREKLPAITRKVKACAACRKQKIKCIMKGDKPPCTRCTRRGLSCVLNKSLQSLIDESRQSEVVQSDVMNLHTALVEVCHRLNMPQPPPLGLASSSKGQPGVDESHLDDLEDESHDREMDQPPEYLLQQPHQQQQQQQHDDGDHHHHHHHHNHHNHHHRQQLATGSSDVSPSMSPVQVPIDSFAATNGLRRGGNAEQDLISKGIISLETGEQFAQRYFTKLDAFIYGIVGSSVPEQDLAGLRRASPVLVAAVCTVAALDDPADSATFDACNAEFRRLVSASLFEDRDVEYIRALCIASYWLSDSSRILCADALRRAADVRLHKCFHQIVAPETPSATADGAECCVTPTKRIDRIRLWYLMYVCDQHLAILYNRNTIVKAEQDIVLGWESFINSGHTHDDDDRIVSQVALLVLMCQVRECFGSDSGVPVSKTFASSFANYNRLYDQWLERWSAVLKPNKYIGEFPRRALLLHYNFAKLHLGYHVFRGLRSDPIPSHFITAALIAHSSAIAIFELIQNDKDLQDALASALYYFHAMLAFAGSFLLEVSSKYWQQLSIDVDANVRLVESVIAIFAETPRIPQHPVNRMIAGLRRKLFAHASSTGRTKPMSISAESSSSSSGGSGGGGGGDSNGGMGGAIIGLSAAATTNTGGGSASVMPKPAAWTGFEAAGDPMMVPGAAARFYDPSAMGLPNQHDPMAFTPVMPGMDMAFNDFHAFDFPEIHRSFM